MSAPRALTDHALLKRVLDILGRAMALARDAAPLTSMRKAHQDFVTDVDMAIDRFLQIELSKLIDGCPILSEERAVDHGRLPRYWIVDPIDGTLNLVAGLPFYGVSIALIDRAGPRLAAVGSVAQGSVWSALRGKGAWCDGARLQLSAAPPDAPHDVPDNALHEAPKRPPPLIVLSTGLLDLLQTAGPNREGLDHFAALRGVGKVRNFGAQSLHLCAVASGQVAAVASVEARVWDEAAGGLIVREAGGHWSARSDVADWEDPAALMAITEQRSLAAHPQAATEMARILDQVFSETPAAVIDALETWVDSGTGPEPQKCAEADTLAVRSLLALDRKARRIAPRGFVAEQVTQVIVVRALPQVETPGLPPPDTGAADADTAAPDWQTGAFVCPREMTLDTPLLIAVRTLDGRTYKARLTPAVLEDVTPPHLTVSRVFPDLAHGRINVAGWVAGAGKGPQVIVYAGGRELQRILAARRPDVAAINSFLPVTCGFGGFVELTPEHVATLRTGTLRLELRLMDGTHLLQAVPLADINPADHAAALGTYDHRGRIVAKAAAASRPRLERLLASEAFRRRWQAPRTESCKPGEPQSDAGRTGLAWIARTAIVAALIPQLRSGDEIAVRLYNGDLVLCQPVDDTILARKFLISAGDERGFLDWLETQVAPGARVLDIGAAYGMISRALARRGVLVTAVEADPTSADRIRRSGVAFGTGKIDLIEMAVSDRVGEVVFAGMGRTCVGSGKILETGDAADLSGFLDEISHLNLMPLEAEYAPGRKERHAFSPDEVDLIRVPSTTIDAICTERGLSDLALMKIDIEGGELMALRGAAGLLDGAFGTPPVVVFEFSSLFPMRGGEHEEVLDLFFRRGWQLFVQKGGKSAGGGLVAVARAADAPSHDNIIAFPPGLRPGSLFAVQVGMPGTFDSEADGLKLGAKDVDRPKEGGPETKKPKVGKTAWSKAGNEKTGTAKAKTGKPSKGGLAKDEAES